MYMLPVELLQNGFGKAHVKECLLFVLVRSATCFTDGAPLFIAPSSGIRPLKES